MKLAVITACLYPDTKPIHYLQASCDRQGIKLIPHGVGVAFGGWAQTLISTTVPAMRDLQREGYTHVLYTDGSDSIIIAEQDEILARYLRFGLPLCLMSADSECFPDCPNANERFTGPLPWRYVNGGGYIGEIEFIVSMWTRLAQKYDGDGNHQSWLVQEWPIDGLLLDHGCGIFQVMDGNPKLYLNGTFRQERRLLNLVSPSYPSVLHFRGGYSDPVTGRDERIEPVWRQLYGE